MNLPVLPRWARRTIRDPLYAVGAPVVGGLLLAAGGVARLIELPSRRKRASGLLWSAAAAVRLDYFVFVGCIKLWCTDRPGPGDELRWKEQHSRLLGKELHRFLTTVDRLIGLDLSITVPPLRNGEPLLVLSRHAGAGDSLLMVYVITHELHRIPQVVLKRELLWDPAMDLALGRLDAYFLRGNGVTPTSAPPSSAPSPTGSNRRTRRCCSRRGATGPHDATPRSWRPPARRATTRGPSGWRAIRGCSPRAPPAYAASSRHDRTSRSSSRAIRAWRT